MPRWITCMKATTPTLRKGRSRDDPAAYQRFKPIERLTLTIEPKYSRRDVGREGAIKRGLMVVFSNGRFELPDLRFETQEQKEQLVKELRNRVYPLTFEEAEKMYRFLADNESGELDVSYQIDPSDPYWEKIGALHRQPVPDKLVSADHKRETEVTNASDAVVKGKVQEIKVRRGRPRKTETEMDKHVHKVPITTLARGMND